VGLLTAGELPAVPHRTGPLAVGFDCEGSSAGYQTWAAGITSAGGRGNLTSQALPVSLSDNYWLYLSLPPSQSPQSGLLGSFTAAGKFSGYPAGNPACQ